MSWKCLHCNVPNPEVWQPLVAITDADGKALSAPGSRITVRLPEFQIIQDDRYYMAQSGMLFWTQCRNVDCGKMVVAFRFGKHHEFESSPTLSQEWFAIPQQRAARPVDKRVPEPFRRDYIEASLILDDSPRMSSVLSRRILQDLLEQFADRKEYKLEDRIDLFIADPRFPSTIKDNLHHLRDIANFGAHTKKDKATGEIIEVDRNEAEWTLEVLDGLFDYFIVGPAKHKERREEWDKKRSATGAARPVRKPKNGQ
jgi:Domain of unknown function (DUF4145)